MSNNNGLILMYHHVADVYSDAGALGVSPRHFAEQLEVLRKEARPLRLGQLTRHLRDGSIPSGSAVITFDDGYADNLLNAKPLLERYEIPATVFVATGPMNDGSHFWWDELERVFLWPGVLPERLELRVDGATVQCDLGGSARYTWDVFSQFRAWKSWEEPPTPRHSQYNVLRHILLPMCPKDQRAVMEDIKRWAGAIEDDSRSHRPLSVSEVRALSQTGLIEVGAHTVTHPMLSTLARDQQREEIQGSKSYLEEALATTVSSFAYPYGDFLHETLEIAREAGFSCACSTIMGTVRQDTDPFQLPRLHVSDWDGDEFGKWLRRSQSRV